jgi:hypothetical protein
MREEPRPSEIRRLVLKLFRQWGTAPSRLFEMQEKIRVDRHRVIARTYCVDRLMAMWLSEVGILQFYDADGRMLATIHLRPAYLPQRAAA